MLVPSHCSLIGPASPVCCEDFHPALLQENIPYTKIQNCRVDCDSFGFCLGCDLLRRGYLHP